MTGKLIMSPIGSPMTLVADSNGDSNSSSQRRTATVGDNGQRSDDLP
jgi:hypothetical protein